MNKKRDITIDHLRGIAIALMIFIHAFAYYLQSRVAFFLWNLTHFVVPLFIFCSFYLFFQKHTDLSGNIIGYIKKRFIRLLVPYYMFLIFYFGFRLLTHQSMSFGYIDDNLLVIGGVDINWLVLLFLVFTVISVLLSVFATKFKSLFYGFGIVSFSSTIILLFYTPPVQFKLVMWLPWSILIFFTYFFQNIKKHMGKSLGILALLMGSSYLILTRLHHSTTMYNNEYPPDLFFLSYGMIMILVFYKLSEKGVFNHKLTNGLLAYLSRYSYELFFIHYIILQLLTVRTNQVYTNWVVFSVLLFILTLVTHSMIRWLLKGMNRADK